MSFIFDSVDIRIIHNIYYLYSHMLELQNALESNDVLSYMHTLHFSAQQTKKLHSYFAIIQLCYSSFR